MSDSQHAHPDTAAEAKAQANTLTTAPPTTPTPTAPPTAKPLNRAQVMLLEFLQEHDAACPLCGYNVRALTRPVCPECKQELVLTVGAARLRMGWLFAAVAPGFFSGIAALFVLIPTLGRPLFGDGRWEPLIVGLDLFGWCSAIFAMCLAFGGRWRTWFLSLPVARQRWFALTIWAIHIGAFAMFVLLLIRFG